ncbi:MAG: hypothetical protein K2P48_07765 [Lachnospiraceae bacterium]|nr:hypothetical protein [Lachnospiraceae bacterium]
MTIWSDLRGYQVQRDEMLGKIRQFTASDRYATIWKKGRQAKKAMGRLGTDRKVGEGGRYGRPNGKE